MRDVYEVLQQKEAEIANVRHQIQSLKLVSSLLSDELALKDARELLRQKEADVARVRHEIENLKIVAPLLSEELASDELTKTRADTAAEEARDSDDRSKATGTDGLFSSVIANPLPTFWKRLKRKT
jgi:septal ring factor EnvC (AmiA/AmiB activator)